MQKSFDTIIVGQGLAGSILAYTLVNHGQKVLIIDDHHKDCASKVAAGIINPISGHRLNISEGFTKFHQVAEPFYQELNKQFNSTIYQRVPQLRLIKNPGQQDYFEQRLQQTAYKGLISAHKENSSDEKQQNASFDNAHLKVAEVKATAILNVDMLLSLLRSWIAENGSLVRGKFDYSALESDESSGVSYGEIQAKRIVFCEGFQAIYNPWLSGLPFKLSKGEVITVKLNQPCQQLLNWGQWLTPSNEQGIAKSGSTYIWNDVTSNPSKENCDEILAKLNKMTTANATLLSTRAGIRPTTKYRIPFIGPLNNLRNALCFNGFGSKGCLTIPFYAELLADHILNETLLAEELSKWL